VRAIDIPATREKIFINCEKVLLLDVLFKETQKKTVLGRRQSGGKYGGADEELPRKRPA